MKIIGLITRVGEGTIENGKNAGQDWQMITVEGLRMFVPHDLQNGFKRGMRVKAEVLHKGDKKLADGQGKTLGYESEYELMTVEILPASDFD